MLDDYEQHSASLVINCFQKKPGTHVPGLSLELVKTEILQELQQSVDEASKPSLPGSTW
ncbi:hypothetical protein NIES4073_66070 [Kalymmatonema gypsitolerans NIES-4073]|nr:hypothetical protein NIES4073_66070 [Scytonema sp. NIES-4073]